MSGERRGRGRELETMRHYRALGYVAYRLAWGCADVLALKAGEPPLLVQVKSTAGGAFERFGPRERLVMLCEAQQAGARAVLVWWPAHGSLLAIDSDAWPAVSQRLLDEYGVAA